MNNKAFMDFDARNGFLIKGKPVEVWFVGGAGHLLKKGNKIVITEAALKALFQKWIEQSHT